MSDLPEFIKTLPAPLNADTYTLLRKGIWESDEFNVYVNDQRDFSFLYPSPFLDYESYEPRVKTLGLKKYRKNNADIIRRFNKIKKYFNSDAESFLEIGCGDASFLLEAYNEYNNIKYSCLEKDQNTIDERNKCTWLEQYNSFEEIIAANRKFDLIGFFHVFEHIKSPTEFLKQCRSVLSEKGCLLIEVPSFDDPLLQLYKSDIYSKFYFQKQHPYIYSAGSIQRVLENNGFNILELIPFQRYSLENHLNWLVNSKPGGNEEYHAVFKDIDDGYRHAIEKTGKSDSVIFIVQ